MFSHSQYLRCDYWTSVCFFSAQTCPSVEIIRIICALDLRDLPTDKLLHDLFRQFFALRSFASSAHVICTACISVAYGMHHLKGVHQMLGPAQAFWGGANDAWELQQLHGHGGCTSCMGVVCEVQQSPDPQCKCHSQFRRSFPHVCELAGGCELVHSVSAQLTLPTSSGLQPSSPLSDSDPEPSSESELEFSLALLSS